ncbi:MAG: hypothetical protein R3B67_12665 [Phycisphaerales bacterium]
MLTGELAQTDRRFVDPTPYDPRRLIACMNDPRIEGDPPDDLVANQLMDLVLGRRPYGARRPAVSAARKVAKPHDARTASAPCSCSRPPCPSTSSAERTPIGRTRMNLHNDPTRAKAYTRRVFLQHSALLASAAVTVPAFIQSSAIWPARPRPGSRRSQA